MECPVDGSVLEKFTRGSVVVEKCPICQGLWFEKGELRQAEESEGLDEIWKDFELWTDHDAFETKWSSRKCPVCSKKMAVITYGHTAVKIDYCLEDHGLWLDQGEFERIIDALHKEMLTKSLPEYISVSLDEAKEIITGDKGVIQEWKDFSTVFRLLEYRILVDNPKLMDVLIALGKTPF